MTAPPLFDSEVNEAASVLGAAIADFGIWARKIAGPSPIVSMGRDAGIFFELGISDAKIAISRRVFLKEGECAATNYLNGLSPNQLAVAADVLHTLRGFAPDGNAVLLDLGYKGTVAHILQVANTQIASSGPKFHDSVLNDLSSMLMFHTDHHCFASDKTKLFAWAEIGPQMDRSITGLEALIRDYTPAVLGWKDGHAQKLPVGYPEIQVAFAKAFRSLVVRKARTCLSLSVNENVQLLPDEHVNRIEGIVLDPPMAIARAAYRDRWVHDDIVGNDVRLLPLIPEKWDSENPAFTEVPWLAAAKKIRCLDNRRHPAGPSRIAVAQEQLRI